MFVEVVSEPRDCVYDVRVCAAALCEEDTAYAPEKQQEQQERQAQEARSSGSGEGGGSGKKTRGASRKERRQKKEQERQERALREARENGAAGQTKNDDGDDPGAMLGLPARMPRDRHQRGAAMTDAERLQYREATRNMFLHAYRGYLEHAYPSGELRPLSCSGGDFDLIEIGRVTLIDAVDTVAVMGLEDEFRDAVQRIIDGGDFDVDENVSVFETNIRLLGGLLSAHLFAIDDEFWTHVREQRNGQRESSDGDGDDDSRSGASVPRGTSTSGRIHKWYNGELLGLAVDLGNRLLPAFDTATGIPYGTVNLRYGVPNGETPVASTAGAGSLTMEMGILSALTGDPKYREAAETAVFALYDARSGVGLLGKHVNALTGKWSEPISGIGSNSDSFYEYLLKMYTLFGDDLYWDLFADMYNAIKANVQNGDWFADVDMYTGKMRRRRYENLQAFWPAMEVATGRLDTASRLLNAGFMVWRDTGFLPEEFDHVSWHPGKAGGQASYPLRPELIESTHEMYRATHDAGWLHAGTEFLRSIARMTRTDCGYATVKDVGSPDLDDHMPSFFLSETAKYLYLLFDEDNFLHHKPYVFTTEAHPVRSDQLHRLMRDRLLLRDEAVHELHNSTFGTFAPSGAPKSSAGARVFDNVQTILQSTLSWPTAHTVSDAAVPSTTSATAALASSSSLSSPSPSPASAVTAAVASTSPAAAAAKRPHPADRLRDRVSDMAASASSRRDNNINGSGGDDAADGDMDTLSHAEAVEAASALATAAAHTAAANPRDTTSKQAAKTAAATAEQLHLLIQPEILDMHSYGVSGHHYSVEYGPTARSAMAETAAAGSRGTGASDSATAAANEPNTTATTDVQVEIQIQTVGSAQNVVSKEVKVKEKARDSLEHWGSPFVDADGRRYRRLQAHEDVIMIPVHDEWSAVAAEVEADADAAGDTPSSVYATSALDQGDDLEPLVTVIVKTGKVFEERDGSALDVAIAAEKDRRYRLRHGLPPADPTEASEDELDGRMKAALNAILLHPLSHSNNGWSFLTCPVPAFWGRYSYDLDYNHRVREGTPEGAVESPDPELQQLASRSHVLISSVYGRSNWLRSKQQSLDLTWFPSPRTSSLQPAHPDSASVLQRFLQRDTCRADEYDSAKSSLSSSSSARGEEDGAMDESESSATGGKGKSKRKGKGKSKGTGGGGSKQKSSLSRPPGSPPQQQHNGEDGPRMVLVDMKELGFFEIEVFIDGFLVHNTRDGEVIEISNVGTPAVFVRNTMDGVSTSLMATLAGTVTQCLVTTDLSKTATGGVVPPFSAAVLEQPRICAMASFGPEPFVAKTMLDGLPADDSHKDSGREEEKGSHAQTRNVVPDTITGPFVLPYKDPKGCIPVPLPQSGRAVVHDGDDEDGPDSVDDFANQDEDGDGDGNWVRDGDVAEMDEVGGHRMSDRDRAHGNSKEDQVMDDVTSLADSLPMELYRRFFGGNRKAEDRKRRRRVADLQNKRERERLQRERERRRRKLERVTSRAKREADGGASSMGASSSMRDDPLPYAGRILLVQRGHCMFEEKTRIAQAAGAAGVVVINNEDSVFVMAGMNAVGEESSELVDLRDSVRIPTVMVSHEDGENLWAYAEHTLEQHPAKHKPALVSMTIHNVTERPAAAMGMGSSSKYGHETTVNVSEHVITVFGKGEWGAVLSSEASKGAEWQLYIVGRPKPPGSASAEPSLAGSEEPAALESEVPIPEPRRAGAPLPSDKEP